MRSRVGVQARASHFNCAEAFLRRHAGRCDQLDGRSNSPDQYCRRARVRTFLVRSNSAERVQWRKKINAMARKKKPRVRGAFFDCPV